MLTAIKRLSGQWAFVSTGNSLLKIARQRYATITANDIVYTTSKNEQFLIRQLTAADEDRVVEYLETVFLKTEPISRALKVDPKIDCHLLRAIARNALQYPLSCMVLESKTGKVIGARLYSIGDRKDPVDAVDTSEFTWKEMVLVDLLSKMQRRFWKTVDEGVNRIIWRDITGISEEHMRKGIARFLASHLITPEYIAEFCVQGIASEASSLANQKLLEKYGYHRMFEIRHDEILDEKGEKVFNCDDGTDRIVLFFKRF